MQNVKVIIWGLGAMGGGMAKMLLNKKGVDIVGVVGRGAKSVSYTHLGYSRSVGYSKYIDR